MERIARIRVSLSVIEVFAQDGICLSSRVYPLMAESTGVYLFAEEGAAHVESMRVWRLGL